MSGIKIVVTGIVSIVIQFGLAIAGWGGWDQFFRHPPFRALAVVTVLLAVLAVPSSGSLSSGEKEDRGSPWVLAAFSVIALLMAFFSSYTDRIGFWDSGRRRHTLGGSGSVLSGRAARLVAGID